MFSVNIALESLCSALTAVLLAFSLTNRQYMKENRYFIWVIVNLLIMLLSDLLTWVVPYRPCLRVGGYICITINYLSGYLLVHSFVCYISAYIQKHDGSMRVLLIFSAVFAAASSLLVLISLPYGFIFAITPDGKYVLGDYYLVSNVYSIVLLAASVVVICVEKGLSRKERIVFLTYPVFPIIGVLIDVFISGQAATAVTAFLSVFIVFMQTYAQQGQRLAQQEAELAQSRISIMLSQIQPHFLYNALTTIKCLCARQDPHVEEVVTSFSKYLRGNMDSLVNKLPIPFEDELNHLRNYLAIESLRFPKVSVVYDLRVMDFVLPALTVQPLVENAIRYGLNRKKSGAGTRDGVHV